MGIASGDHNDREKKSVEISLACCLMRLWLRKKKGADGALFSTEQ
jgi:hypothetical protein